VQIDVADSGVGIPLKTQKRIFERFFRGEDPLVLATAGTGLGLAISKIMIEMHHGRIWFTSSGEPGRGSTFSFTIPVNQPEG
jgi:signal transduction histidine kinase